MTPTHAGHLAMLLFSVLIAGSFSLGALAANDIAPLALNAVRFWIACVIIGVAALVTTGIPRSALCAPWRYVMLAVFFTTYFVLMFEGLKTAAPVSAAAVFTLTPILSAAFGWLLLRQVLTGRMALALAIGAAGAVWVIFRADIAAILRFEIGKGEAIYFWGCVSHAVYTPMVRKLNRGEPTLVFTFGTLLAGATILTAVGWRDLMATDWMQLPEVVWVAIIYTAVVASAMTFTLLQFAALRLPSSKVMAYTYLTPSWVIVWDIALGHAAPPALVLVGLGLTVVALVMLLRD
ncbi:EamA family transporter [Loktanella sp. D2R18]|uniref:DMT family transporter n=1 Tax=Rhodobacterales TaxID=204455 RepID=UPI000DE911EC|nr:MULTISPECIES: DMT family transporter [Rhodobacterales]MDO6588790.1 DMT family transporter [Yoonia sp. 1_MG-2023]RBW41979.1 EamA family transporter [Loktanella sp. D2R18]